MEKVLKILKVNVLSLIALPLLLLATACKLIAKALEKVSVILGMLVLTGFLVAGFEFVKNPGSGLQFIAGLLVLLFLAGLFVALILLLIRFAAAIISAVWNAIIAFFEAIYDFTYIGFLKLYAACENDYQYINLNGKKGLNAFLCLFYTLLRAVNTVIITVISWALIASVILSVLLVASTLLSLNNSMRKTFGLNLFQAIGRFDAFSLVYGIVMFLCIMSLFIVVLLSLGIEWHEWAMELKLTSDELNQNISDLQKNDWHLAHDPELPSETADAYMRNLEEHVNSLETLGDLVESILVTKDNALLRSTWGNYFRNLSEIVEECSKYKKGIPLDKFKKLIPQIQQLEKQREDVKTMAEKLKELHADPVKSSVFFSGCNTAEKLEKRYKSLCKAYHPDAEGGDKETFQKMQDEYQNLKEVLTKD